MSPRPPLLMPEIPLSRIRLSSILLKKILNVSRRRCRIETYSYQMFSQGGEWLEPELFLLRNWKGANETEWQLITRDREEQRHPNPIPEGKCTETESQVINRASPKDLIFCLQQLGEGRVKPEGLFLHILDAALFPKVLGQFLHCQFINSISLVLEIQYLETIHAFLKICLSNS